MSCKEIAQLLLEATRPLDVFGNISKEEIKKKYKKMAKICHPDMADKSEIALASETIKLLNQYYNKALDEIENGTYNITDEKELLKSRPVMFDFNIRDKNYKFYKYLCEEDVCDIYEGLDDDELICLKIVSDKNDNSLIDNEWHILQKLNHYSAPKALMKIKINDKNALLFKKDSAITIEKLKKIYGNLDGSHLCWILERLLSATGYLHSQKIVHGNIKEENILIDVDNHNVIIKDYTLAINGANDKDKKYQIINDDYTPPYVNKDAVIIPNVDIYAVGKIAINLLGGDVSKVALPISCDIRLREFIRNMLKPTQNDAWKLWDELIKLREEIYGTKKFQPLQKKKVRRNY